MPLSLALTVPGLRLAIAAGLVAPPVVHPPPPPEFTGVALVTEHGDTLVTDLLETIIAEPSA